MAISLKHVFVSPKADTADASLIRPSQWNAEHNVNIGGQRLAGRSAGTAGAVGEVALGSGLAWSGNTIVTTGLGAWTATKLTTDFNNLFDKAGGTFTGNQTVRKANAAITIGTPPWRVHIDTTNIYFYGNGANQMAFLNSGRIWSRTFEFLDTMVANAGTAQINGRLLAMGYRMVSVYYMPGAHVELHNGSVVTGVNSGSVGEVLGFYGRYLQAYDNVRGWQAFVYQ